MICSRSNSIGYSWFPNLYQNTGRRDSRAQTQSQTQNQTRTHECIYMYIYVYDTRFSDCGSEKRKHLISFFLHIPLFVHSFVKPSRNKQSGNIFLCLPSILMKTIINRKKKKKKRRKTNPQLPLLSIIFPQLYTINVPFHSSLHPPYCRTLFVCLTTQMEYSHDFRNTTTLTQNISYPILLDAYQTPIIKEKKSHNIYIYIYSFLVYKNYYVDGIFIYLFIYSFIHLFTSGLFFSFYIFSHARGKANHQIILRQSLVSFSFLFLFLVSMINADSKEKQKTM